MVVVNFGDFPSENLANVCICRDAKSDLGWHPTDTFLHAFGSPLFGVGTG